MRTLVVLTIDVEASIAGAYRNPRTNGPLIEEPVWGEIDGRSEALGFIIRTLSAYGLAGTFFVETAHISYFSGRPMGRYVEALTKAGQDVQLHLHPTWHDFHSDRGSTADHCHMIDKELLVRLIEDGADQIGAWTGRRPTAFRAGNFSADRAVFKAIWQAGLRYSSTICAAFPATGDPSLRLAGGVHGFDGIVELPVTCFADRGPVGRGRLRPIQVTACSSAEMRRLLNQLHAAGGAAAVIVTHPFEYLLCDDYRYTNMRPNRMVQHRLESLCAFLAGNADRFETVPLEVAARICASGRDATPLTGLAATSIIRAAQNFINDRIN